MSTPFQDPPSDSDRLAATHTEAAFAADALQEAVRRLEQALAIAGQVRQLAAGVDMSTQLAGWQFSEALLQETGRGVATRTAALVEAVSALLRLT
jgi:hypothetical protein